MNWKVGTAKIRMVEWNETGCVSSEESEKKRKKNKQAIKTTIFDAIDDRLASAAKETSRIERQMKH